MQKRSFWAKIAVLAILTVLTCAAVPAQAKPEKDEPKRSAIPEDQQTWAAAPWLVGCLAGAAVIALGFKNARRSHLD